MIKKKDKIFSMIITFVVILFLFFMFYEKEVSLVIYCDEYQDGAIAQLFYDIGDGYSEEYVSTYTVSNKAKIKLPEKNILLMKGLRADFSNKEGKIYIRKIKLKKNGLTVRQWSPVDLAKRVIRSVNAEEYINYDCLIIDNDSSGDGQVYFDNIMVEQIKAAYSIQCIEIIAWVIFVVVIGILYHFRERIIIPLVDYYNQHKWIVAVIFVLGVLFCYKEYIFGNLLFIFTYIGGDSSAQTYPNLYRCAYLIENRNKLLGFDFTRGYGAVRNINVINIFDWMLLFGTDNLAYLMGIGQVLKIILSFFLFYYYLRLLKRKEITCYVGAAAYALCGHMVMRQYWKGYSNEVVLSALLLIALELSISKGKREWLPGIVLLYCVTMGDYNSILAFALVVGYTVFRYAEMHTQDVRRLIKGVLYNVSAYILAMVGSFAYLLYPLLHSLSSERMLKGGAGFNLSSLLEFENKSMLKAAFLRTISEGIENSQTLFYRSNPDILSGPTFYCSLLILIFIPYAIYKLDRKEKYVAAVVTILSIAYIIFPNLRYIVNGFGGVIFKISSFWVIILMLYYGTFGIDNWLDSTKNINYYSLFFLSIIIILLGDICFEREDLNIRMVKFFVVISLLIMCVIIFKSKIDLKYIQCLLVIIVFMDLFTNAFIFSNTEIAITQDGLSRYDDDAIEYIKVIDDNMFYRIEDKDNKGPTCNALVQNYYGLVDYSGGTSMNDNIHRFLKDMNVARLQPRINHYTSGLSNANDLYDILCVKYITTSEDTIDNNYGLKFLTEYNGKTIYENGNILPLGFYYTSYIKEDDLEKLGIQERRRALLDSAVLSTDIEIKELTNRKSDIYKFDLEGEDISYEYDKDTRVVNFSEVSGDKVTVLDFDMKSEYNELGVFGQLRYGNLSQELGTVNIGSEETDSKQSFVFTGNNISYFSCDVGDMDNIKITVYDKEDYYRKTDEYLQNRKNSGFNCTNFSSNYITGTVSNDQSAILYFAIPYDKGWNIYVDGEKADLLKVNYGFIGAYLNKGEHSIELKYRIPYLKISIVVSMTGIILIVIWFIYWHKKGKENTNDQNINSSAGL